MHALKVWFTFYFLAFTGKKKKLKIPNLYLTPSLVAAHRVTKNLYAVDKSREKANLLPHC